MRIKRIGVLSLGKIMGALYGLMGLIFGGIFSLIALLGAAVGSASGDMEALFGVIFGLGAVIAMPIFYGGMGFLMGLLTAVLYNVVASMVGGLELEFDQPSAPVVQGGAESAPPFDSSPGPVL